MFITGDLESGQYDETCIHEGLTFDDETIHLSWEIAHFVNCTFNGTTTFFIGPGMDADGCYRVALLENCTVNGEIVEKNFADDTSIEIVYGNFDDLIEAMGG